MALVVFCPLALSGQGAGIQEASRVLLNERIEALQADGLIDQVAISNLLEAYEARLRKPLVLSTATLEELLTLPLLTEYQAYQLIQFRLEHRTEPMDLTILKRLKGWSDEDVILYAPLFTTATPQPSPGRLSAYLRDGRGQLSLLATYPWLEDETRRAYVGPAEALSLRYHWQSRSQVSFALGADKDSYEPWHYGRRWGFDSYHGHWAWRGKGMIRTVVLGQFRSSWAEGLLLNQGMRPRSLAVSWVGSRQGFRPSTGVSEMGVSQGVGIELQLSRCLSLSLLGSYRRIDGRVDSETRVITALSDVGLHRTTAELARRHTVRERYAGVRLAFRLGRRLELALQGLHCDWGGDILRGALGAAYNPRLSHLNKHAGFSASYAYTSARGDWALAGELATNPSGAWAMLHRWRGELPGVSCMAAIRHLSPDYWAYLGQSLTHYRYPARETGLALVLIPDLPIRYLSIMLEGDLYQRKRGDVAQPDNYGGILRLSASYRLSDDWSAQLQSSYRWSEVQHGKRLSYQLRRQRGGLTLTAQLQATQANPADPGDWGWALGLRASYALKPAWRLFAAAAYFDSENWNNRLYFSEPRLSLQYRSTVLYGRGVYLSAGGSCALSEHLQLGLRCVQSLQLGPRPRSTDLSLQLIYR